MTKLNIVEFTDKVNLVPKEPYQINDWEVTSIKNKTMHLWKYFHRNGVQDLYGDGEFILLSDISLKKEEVENILKDRKEEFVITQKFKLSIFGRIFTKLGQLIFSGQISPYLIRNHCVFCIKKSSLEDKNNLLNLQVNKTEDLGGALYKTTISQVKHTWYLLRYFNPSICQLILFGIVGIIGMGFDLSIVTILREGFEIDTRLCSLISFPFAVTSNYLLNRKFTFQGNEVSLIFGYIKFFAVNIFGLLTRIWTIHYILFFFPFLETNFYLPITMLGILVAFFINFFMSKLFVFKK